MEYYKGERVEESERERDRDSESIVIAEADSGARIISFS